MRDNPVTFWLLILLVGITMTLGGYCACCGCPGTMCSNGTLPVSYDDEETSGTEADPGDETNVVQFDDPNGTYTETGMTEVADFTPNPGNGAYLDNFLDDRGVTAVTCARLWRYTDTSETVAWELFASGVSVDTGVVQSIIIDVIKFLDQDNHVRIVKYKAYEIVPAIGPGLDPFRSLVELYHLDEGVGPIDCCNDGPWTLTGFDQADKGIVLLADSGSEISADWAAGNNWNAQGTSEIDSNC